MSKTILITGGARSGKSAFAEKLAKETGEKVLYIATSIPFDDEMKERVKRHKAQRPAEWDTYEGYRNLGDVITEKGKSYDGILVDCITIMATNLMFDSIGFEDQSPAYEDFLKAEEYISIHIENLKKGLSAADTTVILVTNELGSGVVPDTAFGRAFRDIAGRANRQLAEQADEVYLVVCGIPMKIK